MSLKEFHLEELDSGMKFSWIQPMIYVLILAITIVIMRLLGKTKSLKVSEETLNLEATKEEKKELQRLNAIAVLFMITLMPLVGYFVFKIFDTLASIYFEHVMNYEIILKFPQLGYALPAIFIGILSPHYPYIYCIQRKYKNEKTQRLINLLNRQYRLNTRMLPNPLTNWGIVICTLFFVHFLFVTSYVRDDKIYVHPFLALTAKQYNLSDISEVIRAKSFKAPNGNIVHRTTYYVKFKDGFQWHINSDEKTDSEFVNALATKSNASYTDKDFY